MAKKTVVRRHSKRLPMSTDLDDALRADDELFMPEAQPAEPAQPEVKPGGSKRASRLQKVVDQAPAPDDDGVIDMDPGADMGTVDDHLAVDDRSDSPI
jgi:recombination protein RecT